MFYMIPGNRLADAAYQCLLRAMTPTETEESRALAWGTAIHGLIRMCESDVMYAMRARRSSR
jgi:hypothetical protein